MEYKYFAKNLKELQTEKGIKTQIEFARFIGVSKSFVSVLLLGEKLPSMDTALDICKKFDVNLDWLMLNKGAKRQGESINLQRVIDISHLSHSRQQEVEAFIRFQESQENKPLTPELKNVGGEMIPEPSQPLQAQDRRETTLSSYHAMLRQTCKAR